jgi:hypothetical protein
MDSRAGDAFRAAAPPDFLEEVTNVVAEFAHEDDPTLLTYLTYHQGAVEWGGILLQQVLPIDIVVQLPPLLSSRVVGHWDVVLWHATVGVASGRRLLTGRVRRSPATDVIAQAVVDLAMATWYLSWQVRGADPGTWGSSPGLVSWFASIPEDERAWLQVVAESGAEEPATDRVLRGRSVSRGNHRDPAAAATT